MEVGVVEFGVSGGDFLAVDDEFVNFDGFAAGGDFGEGDEFTGHVGDEEGVEGVFFDFLFENLVDDFVVFHFRGDLDAELFAFFAALLRGDVEKIVAGGLFDEVVVVGAFPGAGEVDGAGGIAVFVFVVDEEGAAEFLGEVAGEFLDEVGHLFEVREGPVGFEHGEFGVMAAGDAFVAEVAVEFEDFGEAADEEAF